MADEKPSELEPPDEFGEAIADIFKSREMRSFGSGGAAMAEDADNPAVKDWPDGASVDATRINFDDLLSDEDTDTPDDQPPSQPAEGEEPASADGADSTDTTPPAEPTPTAPVAPGDGEGAPTTLPAPEGGYDWQYRDPQGNDAVEHYTDDQVREAMMVYAWAQTIPDQARYQMAQIEKNEAVAIPRPEYDQFVAWRNQQGATPPAPPAPPAPPNFDSLDADPEVIEHLKRQQAQLDALSRTQPSQATMPDYSQQQQQQQYAPQQQYAQPQQQNVTDNLDASVVMFEQSARQWAERNNLNEQELEHLVNFAVNANVIETLSRDSTVFSPTGQVLSPPNIPLVAEQSLDYALIRNPQLHAVVNTRKAASPSAPKAEPVVTDAVVAKRTRAASVSSAPSAAVATPPRNVKQMTPNEIVEAMARDIEAAGIS